MPESDDDRCAGPVPRREEPCGRCPWRLDVIPGEFTADRFDYMATTVGEPGREVPLGGPLWACHTSRESQDMVCASWLARVGFDHLTVRLAVATGRIPTEALRPGEDWPTLYDSFEGLAAANGVTTYQAKDNEATGRE